MLKQLLKFAFMIALAAGLSVSVMGQSDKPKQNPPPKNEKKDPPKIPIRPKNDKPKDKGKPKPPEESYAIEGFLKEDEA